MPKAKELEPEKKPQVKQVEKTDNEKLEAVYICLEAVLQRYNEKHLLGLLNHAFGK